MKYAREMIDLMAAYPGRPFRLVELVRHVSQGRQLSVTERTRLERGIQRAADALQSTGSVVIEEPTHGRHGRKYLWRVTEPSHRAAQSVTQSVTIAAG